MGRESRVQKTRTNRNNGAEYHGVDARTLQDAISVADRLAAINIVTPDQLLELDEAAPVRTIYLD